MAAELDVVEEVIENITKSSSQYSEAKDKAFRIMEELREQGCTKKKLAGALRSLGEGAHAGEALRSQVWNSQLQISDYFSHSMLSFCCFD